MPWSKDDLPPSVKHQDWTDLQKEVFVKAANAALEEYGDDGKAIATGTAAAEKASSKQNAKQFPKIFYCRHMLPGIAGYEKEHILIDADAMKQSAPTMVGKPVYVHHQKVDLNTLEQDADGWVVDCFYNELDGWLWAKCLATSDAAQSALQNKWSVSNAYIPLDWSDGGQHLNVDYDRKIRNYEFTHLAIVPNPRYEEAKIFSPEEFKAYQVSKKSELEELQNSKQNSKESGTMFFRSKKEEVKAGDTILDTDFTVIKNDDGSEEQVTVAQLKDAKKNQKALELANAKKNEKMVGDDEEVEVDGEKVNMGALKECYKNMKSVKKNEAEEEEKKKKEEKENAEKEAKEKEEKEEKENALKKKQFEELQNAHNKKPAIAELSIDKQKRGQQRYGSATK